MYGGLTRVTAILLIAAMLAMTPAVFATDVTVDGSTPVKVLPIFAWRGFSP